MKVGQCVEQRFTTKNERPRGHVDRIGSHGEFRVTFAGSRDDRGCKVSGGRIWYPATAATGFKVIA